MRCFGLMAFIGPFVGSALLFGAACCNAQTPSLPQITESASSLPAVLTPYSPQIRYIGRFDTTQPSGPRCAWSASMVKLKFHASAVNVHLNESDNNDEYEVVIDSQPVAVLVPQAGAHLYCVYQSSTPQTHTLALVKRTEPLFGTSQFQGFQLSEQGKLLRLPKASPRRVEVIGDSISCGYGDEAQNQNQHFSSTTENAYLSYGADAARALDAQYTCIAWSGRLMWPTNTMSSIYGLILPTDTNTHWDFSKWIPQAVVIALGTNDFNGGTPVEKDWDQGYEAFIQRVRSHYPQAIIYCATSPMLWGNPNTIERSYLHQIVTDENTAGDKNVRYLDFPTQNGTANGFGADWHPSVKTQAIMGQIMAATLAGDLHWKLSPE
jgi:lysophospholipase L1-like esterase